jgi:hypothetical protein
MYLDDDLGSHPDENMCTAMAAQVKQDLILSGFVPKNEKSIWQPIRQIIFPNANTQIFSHNVSNITNYI